MNRYHIAIDKSLPRESKILKPLLRKLKRKKISDEKRSQDSSEFIASINAVRDTVRRDSSPSSTIRGETGLLSVVPGITVSSSEAIRIDPDSGRVGRSPSPGLGFHLQGGGSDLRVQGSDEDAGFQIRADDPADRTAFFHTGDSVVAPCAPVSQFFTLTGPNGFRVMIPLRRLVLDMRVAEDDFERCTLVMRMNLNQANSMQADINDAKERLGLSRNESL